MGTSANLAHPFGRATVSLLWTPLAGVAAAIVHLGWEATHGGIQSHHLLAREDLPAVSNLWGLLILPALGALAAHFVRRRSTTLRDARGRAVTAFAAAFALGCALSAAFSHGLGDLAAGLFLTALLAGLIAPTYRAEYAFGFVIGMTFVFGSVIPTVVAGMAAAVSALAHFLLRPALSALYRRLRAAS